MTNFFSRLFEQLNYSGNNLAVFIGYAAVFAAVVILRVLVCSGYQTSLSLFRSGAKPLASRADFEKIRNKLVRAVTADYIKVAEKNVAGVHLDAIIEKQPYQVWSFGPKLLENGEWITLDDHPLTRRNPRCAIGYYEPGHYVFVVVDGRQKGYSVGLTMTQLSKLMYNLGCKEAYNLDGGDTAVMIFDDEIVSQPSNGGRRISDIIYVGGTQ